MRKKALKLWLMLQIVSFILYELLWFMIYLENEDSFFDLGDLLTDFVQSAIFTSVVFLVSYGFSKFKNGRYSHSLYEVACALAVNAMLAFLFDMVTFVEKPSEDNYWNLIDIYIICIISTLLSIATIQNAYNKEIVKMNLKQEKMRLMLLQQQLSPHFLFNSLTTLQGMIVVNPEKAEDYVGILSDILRYITTNIDKDQVSLTDAMTFIRRYSEMLETRFPGHFQFYISTGNILDNVYIIPVSIQLTLENAIKHNNHSRKIPLEISILSSEEYVVVKNKKQPIPTSDSLGKGLRNLNERYTLLTGKDIIISETQDYYIVKIPLIYDSINSRR